MKKAAAASVLLFMVAACSRPAEHAAPAAEEHAPAAAARCGPAETPEIQGGEHLIGNRKPPVPYSSIPPTSGWHSSGAFDIAVRRPADPLTEPEQVSVLEVGGVVVTYNRISKPDRRSLEQRVSQRYGGRVAVTPYEKLGSGEIAFSGWGVLQRCNGLDLEALHEFVVKHADERPAEPGEP